MVIINGWLADGDQQQNDDTIKMSSNNNKTHTQRETMAWRKAGGMALKWIRKLYTKKNFSVTSINNGRHEWFK